MLSVAKRLEELEKAILSLSSTQKGEVWVIGTNDDGSIKKEKLQYKFPSDTPLRINILSYGGFDPINKV